MMVKRCLFRFSMPSFRQIPSVPLRSPHGFSAPTPPDPRGTAKPSCWQGLLWTTSAVRAWQPADRLPGRISVHRGQRDFLKRTFQKGATKNRPTSDIIMGWWFHKTYWFINMNNGDLMGYIMNNVISAMLFYAVSCLLTKKLPRIKGLVPIYFGRFTFVDSRRASAHQRTTSTWLPMLILFTIASSQN